MASGQKHEKYTKILSIPFGICLGLFMGITSGILGGIAFVIGGLWLSPDLDTHSKALKRWGIFQGIWWPYRKVIPHRSLLSHGPLVGTSLRMAYLIIWFFLVHWALTTIGILNASNDFTALREYLSLNIEHFWALILGIEGSAWLHLIQDGDPLPSEWRK